MSKKGFTLAELTVTLGIVGVIAAVTIPTLYENTAMAQIGPKLAKAVAMFEQANLNLLKSYEASCLTESIHPKNYTDYIKELSNHYNIQEITYNETTSDPSAGSNLTGITGFKKDYAFMTADGVVYFLSIEDNDDFDTEQPSHKQKIGAVYIDINGTSKPNTFGTDLFAFTWWNDGSLRPAGGKEWNGSIDDPTWETLCKVGEAPSNYYACTGHIFENNLKVRYK